MGRSKRIRRGKAGWLKVFSEQSSSSLSVLEFCRREGINAALFSRWRSRLGSTQSVSVTPPEGLQSSESFIDLGDLRPAGPRLEVRLDLGGGLVLSIARG